MSESLKQKTAKGLFWGAMNSGTTQILNLVIGIVLARHLTKGDYDFSSVHHSLPSSIISRALLMCLAWYSLHSSYPR